MEEGGGDWKVLALEVAVASGSVGTVVQGRGMGVQRGELGIAGPLESTGA